MSISSWYKRQCQAATRLGARVSVENSRKITRSVMEIRAYYATLLPLLLVVYNEVNIQFIALHIWFLSIWRV